MIGVAVLAAVHLGVGARAPEAQARPAVHVLPAWRDVPRIVGVADGDALPPPSAADEARASVCPVAGPVDADPARVVAAHDDTPYSRVTTTPAPRSSDTLIPSRVAVES